VQAALGRPPQSARRFLRAGDGGSRGFTGARRPAQLGDPHPRRPSPSAPAARVMSILDVEGGARAARCRHGQHPCRLPAGYRPWYQPAGTPAPGRIRVAAACPLCGCAVSPAIREPARPRPANRRCDGRGPSRCLAVPLFRDSSVRQPNAPTPAISSRQRTRRSAPYSDRNQPRPTPRDEFELNSRDGRRYTEPAQTALATLGWTIAMSGQGIVWTAGRPSPTSRTADLPTTRTRVVQLAAGPLRLWPVTPPEMFAIREDGFIGVARGVRATSNVTESERWTMRNPPRNARGGVDRMSTICATSGRHEPAGRVAQVRPGSPDGIRTRATALRGCQAARSRPSPSVKAYTERRPDPQNPQV